MADQELIIKINGDVGDWEAALELAGEGTEKLGESLKKITEYAAVAFAALNVEIYESVKAFHDHAVAANQVEAALQNQGLAGQGLVAQYKEMSEAIEKKTGVDKDQILAGIAVGQSILGQTKVTKELTTAVVDFAAKNGLSVPEAFRSISRAVETGTGRLQAYGIQIEQGATRTERMNSILKQLQVNAAGSAEVLADTAGSTQRLSVAFEAVQKMLGEKLAPAFDLVVKGLTSLFEQIEKHEEVATFIADFILAATVVTGLVTVLGTASIAFLAFRTAMIAAGLAAESTAIAVKGLVGATGIGLLVVVLAEVYQHWSTIWPAMQAVFAGFVTFVVEQATALGHIFSGIFHADPSLIKQGIDEWKASFANAATAAVNELNAKLPKVNLDGAADPAAEKAQIDAKKKSADAAEAERDRIDKVVQAKRKAQIELLNLEESNASKDLIDLKKQEIATLTELESKKNSQIMAQLEKHLADVRARETEAQKTAAQQDDVLNNEILAHNEQFQKMDAEQKKQFLQKNKASLEEGLIVKRTQLENAAKVEAEIQKKAHNQYLLDEAKFGTAYAGINQAMHSAIYEGSKSAFGELQNLTQSHNETLKSIGKVAAIANIVVKTAEAAMNIYSGFSSIPIIGIALGIAGAAAAVAFGAEQVASVQGAAAGGLMEGGIPGIDSIPVMAQQGELIAPKKNFDEVVNAVADKRNAQNGGSGGSLGGDDVVALLQSINQNTSQGQGGGQTVNIKGDVFGDPAFLQNLAKLISNGLEFGNVKIFGINQGKRLI